MCEILVTKNLVVKGSLPMKTTPKVRLKASKSHVLLEKLIKKQCTGIACSYITWLLLQISCKIKSLWYIRFTIVNIRWINRETCGDESLRKMSFREIFDFQCIHVAKLGFKPSLKSLRTFIVIKDDTASCRCTYSS